MGGRKVSQSHWNINGAHEKEVRMNVLYRIAFWEKLFVFDHTVRIRPSLLVKIPISLSQF